MIVGIGVDIVEIARLRSSMERFRKSFARRIFTELEQEYCDARSDPYPHYAARFAAKEALFKALGTGWAQGVRWVDVEVRRDAAGPPALILRGEAERHANVLSARRFHLSLSHSGGNAVAVVILEA